MNAAHAIDPHVFVVLLAGGVGSRFWPLSRERRPKQLLDLFGEGPMVKVTLDRVAPFCPAERALIVTSERLSTQMREALPEVPAANMLCEPSGRNTAPAIAWAALEAVARDPEALLMVLPSDHHIGDVPAYRGVVSHALEVAREGHLVTVGIVPSHPETGYGYIERGEVLAGHRRDTFAVARFVEKPDLETALRFLRCGQHLWNAGMFFMPARLFLDELLAHRPTLGRAMIGAGAAGLPAIWDELESVSVDYAVFERSDKVAVVPGSFGWSDVGSWRSLEEHRGEHASFHRGDVVEVDGKDNVLFASGGVVSVVGVDGLVVVHTPDATFVCKKDEAQRAREVVAEVKRRYPGLL